MGIPALIITQLLLTLQLLQRGNDSLKHTGPRYHIYIHTSGDLIDKNVFFDSGLLRDRF